MLTIHDTAKTKKAVDLNNQPPSGHSNLTAYVTTHVVRLKLFRLKAEGGRKARLPYFGGNIWFLHQRWLQNELFPNSLQSSAYPPE